MKKSKLGPIAKEIHGMTEDFQQALRKLLACAKAAQSQQENEPTSNLRLWQVPKLLIKGQR